MAGDYIKIDHELPEKEEVVSLASDPDLTYTDDEARLAVVILRFIRLWIWGDRHTEDGLLRGIDANGCAQRLRGNAQYWHKVCIKYWLEFTEKGAQIPDFRKRFGRSARSRLLAAKRMRKSRDKKRLRATTAQQARNSSATSCLSVSVSDIESTNVDSNAHVTTAESCAQQPKTKAKTKTGKPKVFTIPTIEEITAYCTERKNRVTPQTFFDFYERNGWMVGKNRMKDWKAAVRYWENNGFDNRKETQNVRTTDNRPSARIRSAARPQYDRWARPAPAETSTEAPAKDTADSEPLLP